METAQRTEISSTEDIARLASDYRAAAKVHATTQASQERRGDRDSASETGNSVRVCRATASDLDLLASQVEQGKLTITEAADLITEAEWV